MEIKMSWLGNCSKSEQRFSIISFENAVVDSSVSERPVVQPTSWFVRDMGGVINSHLVIEHPQL